MPPLFDTVAVSVEIQRVFRAQRQLFADAVRRMNINQRDDVVILYPQMQAGLVAQMFDPRHGASDPLADMQMLWPQTDGCSPVRCATEQINRQHVDFRRSQTAGGIDADRILVDFARATELNQLAVIQHTHMGGHCHCLNLVVGDIQHRRPKADLNAL